MGRETKSYVSYTPNNMKWCVLFIIIGKICSWNTWMCEAVPSVT